MHTDNKGDCTRAGYALWALEIAAEILSGDTFSTDREVACFMAAAMSPEGYAAQIEECRQG
jgi:hypothetical protein